jgi:hypothetical protein
VLVLAAGVRRTPAPEKVGLQRLNFEQTRNYQQPLQSD